MSDRVQPERATGQGAEYFNAANKTLELVTLITNAVVHSDFVAYSAARTLAILDTKPEDRERVFGTDSEGVKVSPEELAKSNPGPATKALRRNAQELLEVFLVRSVDSFETYVVSIIRAVLRKEPKILSDSTYELDVKSILDHGSIDSLVDDLVERKVSDLSYRGFDDLQTWCKKHGIPLTVPAGQLDSVIELTATRNLIAHNRGVIDQKYLRIVKTPRFKAGERRELGPDDLFSSIRLLGQIVAATDEAVANTFGLEMLPLKVTPPP